MKAETRHRSQSILSNRTNSTWREDVFTGKAKYFILIPKLTKNRNAVIGNVYIRFL